MYRYKFHYINKDNITYLCMTYLFPEELALAFLLDVQKKFILTYEYEKINDFCAYQLTDFEKNLNQIISYYNTCPQRTQSGEVIKEIKDIKNIETENIEKIIGRDEKMTIIVKNEEGFQGKNFSKMAQQIKKKEKIKKMKTLMIIIGSIAIFLFLIFFILF